MKVKTSVTLSEELLEQLDHLVGPDGSPSAVMERALKQYLVNRARGKRDAEDLEILNREADTLNDEAIEVLSYQGDA